MSTRDLIFTISRYFKIEYIQEFSFCEYYPCIKELINEYSILKEI